MSVPILNTNAVAPEHHCDVCHSQKAKYYNLTYYIHVCSVKCFELFEQEYNREIDEIAWGKLAPDTPDKIKEKTDEV